MPLPKVVIVGRPNVGKSSLMNLLAGRKISIVDPTPGVTRDRVSTIAQPPAHLFEPDSPIVAQPFELIDTGGYGIQDSQNLTRQVEDQIAKGIREADLILFVIDAQAGLLPLDQSVARLLRQLLGPAAGQAMETRPTPLPSSKKTSRKKAAPTQADPLPIAAAGKVMLIANKVDSEQYEAGAAEAAGLGLGEPMMVSATTGFNRRELWQAILSRLQRPSKTDSQQPALGVQLAIVGKRNAGKSTLVNALAGQERVIVSELPGTTRDAVDVRFEMNGKVFTAIDTAGVRKGKSVQGLDIEYYSQHRALRSVRRADVVLLLIDSTVPISQVDQQLGTEIARQFKPVIVVVSKWDLAQEKANQDQYVKYLDKELQGLNFAPVSFICAPTGDGLRELIAMALNLYAQSGHRVPTAELNKVVEQIVAERPPSSGIGRQPKIYYLTQLDVHPPTLGLFVNDQTMFDAPYQRYLINRFRELLPFAEVPIKLIIRGKNRAPGNAAPGSSGSPGRPTPGKLAPGSSSVSSPASGGGREGSAPGKHASGRTGKIAGKKPGKAPGNKSGKSPAKKLASPNASPKERRGGKNPR